MVGNKRKITSIMVGSSIYVRVANKATIHDIDVTR